MCAGVRARRYNHTCFRTINSVPLVVFTTSDSAILYDSGHESSHHKGGMGGVVLMVAHAIITGVCDH